MSDHLKKSKEENHQACRLCEELLTNMQRFFAMVENAHRHSMSDWLTVEEIAEELRISKNVVYRLIRNGELGAINIVDTNGHVAQRGHYRVNRTDFRKYIAAKRVKTSPSRIADTSSSRRSPKIRNHLGL